MGSCFLLHIISAFPIMTWSRSSIRSSIDVPSIGTTSSAPNDQSGLRLARMQTAGPISPPFTRCSKVIFDLLRSRIMVFNRYICSTPLIYKFTDSSAIYKNLQLSSNLMFAVIVKLLHN